MRQASNSPQTIDDYIGSFPPPVQTLLREVRATIRRAAPDASETIKYQIPTFVLHENLVHFAAFKNHIGFYPGASGIAAFASKLKPFKSAKGSVQFPLDKPMPLDLIKRMVEFRVKEALGRAKKKKRR